MVVKAERLYSILEVCKILKIPRGKFDWLFITGRLDKYDFPVYAGKRVFTKADRTKIRQALNTVKKTGKGV